MLKRVGHVAGTVLTLAAALVFLFVSTVEAKGRLGGGRSFGSKPSYQRSAPSPAPSQPGLNQAAPAPQTPSPMGGTGRWGGMLGGMLMGGLIGSLLFGGGYGGGPGLLDILIIGGGLFLLMRFLRARRTAAEAAPGGASGSDLLRQFTGQSGGGAGAAAAAAPASVEVPDGFDANEFMQGAKLIYNRLQSSWDRRDLEDIRQFTAPEVFDEIKAQAEEDPQPGRTEILMVDARLLEAKTVDAQTVAAVLYDATLREGAGDEPAQRVREIWHFGRKENEPGSRWVLEGIQQVND